MSLVSVISDLKFGVDWVRIREVKVVDPITAAERQKGGSYTYIVSFDFLCKPSGHQD